MTYVDKTLLCLDCGGEFSFPAEEQRELAERGFKREPRRCAACREKTEKSREAARTLRSINDRSPRGDNLRPPREFHPAVCTACGKKTEVPFRPIPGRPVYCRECHLARNSKTGGPHETPASR